MSSPVVFTLTLDPDAVVTFWQAEGVWWYARLCLNGIGYNYGPTQRAAEAVGHAVLFWWRESDPDAGQHAWSSEGDPIFLPSSIPPEYTAGVA